MFSTGTQLKNFPYTSFFHKNLEAIVPKASLFKKKLSHVSTEGQFTDFFRTPPLKSQKNHKITKKSNTESTKNHKPKNY